MSMRKAGTWVIVACALLSSVVILAANVKTSRTANAAEMLDPTSPQLGQPMSDNDVARWQKHVFPDGTGLPEGSGTAATGAQLFASHCASCHGDKGQGATAEELVGPPDPPSPGNPAKTIGAYWPQATTLFDFIRRSKPPSAPQSLSTDDVYSLVAFLLTANGVIKPDMTVSHETLAKIQMPNHDGFERIDAP